MATSLGGWEGELAGTRVSFLPRNLTVCHRTRCRREYDERGAGVSGEEAGEQREKAGEGEQVW